MKTDADLITLTASAFKKMISNFYPVLSLFYHFMFRNMNFYNIFQYLLHLTLITICLSVKVCRNVILIRLKASINVFCGLVKTVTRLSHQKNCKGR